MQKKFFLISHNEYAEGLKKALEMIVGKQNNVMAYGLMPGGTPDTITEKIENQITKDMEVVILGDLAGGSVCNSALRLTTLPNVLLITGMNLPLAMEIIVAQATDKKTISAIIEAARQGMKTLKIQTEENDNGDDFFDE